MGAERERLEREHGKLSERLWQLVTAALERDHRPLCMHHAFALAVVAWNLPFFEHAVREQMASETPYDCFPLFMDLYMTRLANFRDDPRLIIQHELVESAPGEYTPILVWVIGDLFVFEH